MNFHEVNCRRELLTRVLDGRRGDVVEDPGSCGEPPARHAARREHDEGDVVVWMCLNGRTDQRAVDDGLVVEERSG